MGRERERRRRKEKRGEKIWREREREKERVGISTVGREEEGKTVRGRSHKKRIIILEKH